MFNTGAIASQIKFNCNISDAKFWGNYLPCGLLLRMRDLYRIENGFNPWDSVDHREVGNWIEEREHLWNLLEDTEYLPITVEGCDYSPFDTEGINAVIGKRGLFYGAGYGYMKKPVFLFARLAKKFEMDGNIVYVVSNELARDLSAMPAMSQGNIIIARRNTMKMFMWDKFQEMKAGTCAGALSMAFSSYGLARDSERRLGRPIVEGHFAEMAEEELHTYLYHEIGETRESERLGQWWKDLLLSLPYSRADMFIRGLKDVLADTCSNGMLDVIISQRKVGSLHFYIALLSGYRKVIAENIIEAYKNYIQTGDMRVLEHARQEMYEQAAAKMDILRDMCESKSVSPETIEKELMGPAV
ncbi:hypothetical protein H8E50_06140 [bacterium]|nr:hypothetical protein [bacterium]